MAMAAYSPSATALPIRPLVSIASAFRDGGTAKGSVPQNGRWNCTAVRGQFPTSLERLQGSRSKRSEPISAQRGSKLRVEPAWRAAELGLSPHLISGLDRPAFQFLTRLSENTAAPYFGRTEQISARTRKATIMEKTNWK